MDAPPPNSVTTSEHPPIVETRIKAFATFFKSYMSVSAIVTAALPIPITKLRLIPMYKSQATLYSTYTSLFCFLVLGFVFYSRHSIARWMFPEELERVQAIYRKGSLKEGETEAVPIRKHWGHRLTALLPLILIVLSLFFAFFYTHVLDLTLSVDRSKELDAVPVGDIANCYILIACYL